MYIFICEGSIFSNVEVKGMCFFLSFFLMKDIVGVKVNFVLEI